jgi:hypothetical protein
VRSASVGKQAGRRGRVPREGSFGEGGQTASRPGDETSDVDVAARGGTPVVQSTVRLHREGIPAGFFFFSRGYFTLLPPTLRGVQQLLVIQMRSLRPK